MAYDLAYLAYPFYAHIRRCFCAIWELLNADTSLLSDLEYHRLFVDNYRLWWALSQVVTDPTKIDFRQVLGFIAESLCFFTISQIHFLSSHIWFWKKRDFLLTPCYNGCVDTKHLCCAGGKGDLRGMEETERRTESITVRLISKEQFCKIMDARIFVWCNLKHFLNKPNRFWKIKDCFRAHQFCKLLSSFLRMTCNLVIHEQDKLVGVNSLVEVQHGVTSFQR